MIRGTTTGLVAALALIFQCNQPSTAFAQGLTNTIPRNQTPLLQTFPPALSEQAPSGTGKFVIFTREEFGKLGEWDFIAGAWECIPSRPEMPVTKRVEFCHSSWEAQPLVDALVRDNSDGLHPRFVRLQVDSGDRDYSVNLYDINYRTWDVRSIWRGDRVSGFGVMKDFIYCRSAKNWFRIRTASGEIIRDLPFIPLDVDGEFWLVQKIGEKSGCWSYDRSREKFVGHFGDVEQIKEGCEDSVLSADGKNRARLLVPMPDDWRGGLINGTLVLQRHGETKDIRIPVKLQARMGSGVPVIPIGTQLSITNGTAKFTARQTVEGGKQSVWMIEVVSGKATESVGLYVEPRENDFALFDGVTTPDYLRPHLKDILHFGRGGLAPAFLMHLGILKKRPEFPDCTAGVSRDGRHILYKAKEGPLANVFIYGDLKTKQIVRWACPAGIKLSDSLEFAWVEAP